MHEHETEILTPLLGPDLARMVMALSTMASALADIRQQALAQQQPNDTDEGGDT